MLCFCSAHEYGRALARVSARIGRRSSADTEAGAMISRRRFIGVFGRPHSICCGVASSFSAGKEGRPLIAIGGSMATGHFTEPRLNGPKRSVHRGARGETGGQPPS